MSAGNSGILEQFEASVVGQGLDFGASSSVLGGLRFEAVSFEFQEPYPDIP